MSHSFSNALFAPVAAFVADDTCQSQVWIHVALQTNCGNCWTIAKWSYSMSPGPRIGMAIHPLMDGPTDIYFNFPNIFRMEIPKSDAQQSNCPFEIAKDPNDQSLHPLGVVEIHHLFNFPMFTGHGSHGAMHHGTEIVRYGDSRPVGQEPLNVNLVGNITNGYGPTALGAFIGCFKTIVPTHFR
jgi:hypothetical protein